MSRFLIVVPPFVGHINPIAGVAAELRDRGHEVAWVGDESVLHRTLPAAGRCTGAAPHRSGRGRRTCAGSRS